HHQRSLQPQFPDERRHRRRLLAQPPHRSARPRRITRPGPVHQNHAKLTRQPLQQRVGEVSHLPTKPVNNHNGRPRSLIQIMNSRAIHIDESPARRQSLLHAPRGDSREYHQPADAHHNKNHCTNEQWNHRGAITRSLILPPSIARLTSPPPVSSPARTPTSRHPRWQIETPANPRRSSDAASTASSTPASAAHPSPAGCTRN